MLHPLELLVELVAQGNGHDLDAWRVLADALEEMEGPAQLIATLRLHADLCETRYKTNASTAIGILPGYALLDFVRDRYGEKEGWKLTPYLALSGYGQDW